MSAGHRHGDERAAAALADEYYDRTAELVAACEVVSSYDVPWLANRSRGGKRVYRDKRVPAILKCGIDTGKSLPWHELAELLGMDDGLVYDDAHKKIATPLERREVERQKPDDPDIWAKYTDEMDGYIRVVDDETIAHVPPDIDLRPFADDDRALLKKIIAAGAEDDDAQRGRPPDARRHTEGIAMPKLLTPADIATRAKEGATPRDIFFDAAGARIAKAVGLVASVAAGVEERSADFTISTGDLDRYNSTIKPDGWQTAAFEKNPVVLWAHDDSIPAIGRAESTRLEGGKLKSLAVFAPADVHPLAETIYRLVKAKFIGAASVGWIPLEYKFVEGGDRGFGIDYLEQELLEWSIVNIPANPECLVGARSMGIDTKPLLQWAERTLDQAGSLLIPRAELEALRRAAGAPTAFGFRRAKTAENATRTAQAKQLAAAMGTLERIPEGLTVDQVAAVLEAALDVDAVSAKPVLIRSGKVLSAKNEKRIRDAHDHCMAACDHMTYVLAQTEPDDGDDTNEDPEQAAADRAAREQRLEELKKARPAA